MSVQLLLPYLHGVWKYRARFLNTPHLGWLWLSKEEKELQANPAIRAAILCHIRVRKRSFTCPSRAMGLFWIPPAETGPPGQLCQRDGGECHAFPLPRSLFRCAYFPQGSCWIGSTPSQDNSEAPT